MKLHSSLRALHGVGQDARGAQLGLIPLPDLLPSPLTGVSAPAHVSRPPKAELSLRVFPRKL